MATDNAQTPRQAAPYATGGGGTVLEHRYGAILLSGLLTGDPLSELGDDATPLSVRFQASAYSPVDDLLVLGGTPDGEQRRVSIGVRRAPKLVMSDRASIPLLASYLRVVNEHWEEVRAGRWRLGLAVVSPNAAARQVSELCVIAHGVTGATEFRTEVGRPKRTNEAVRRRLGHVDALVKAAAVEAGIDADLDGGALTWRLLSVLRLRELRLEGTDETDRTMTVSRLRPATRDGTVAAADQLFMRLEEQAARYAPMGAHVTELLLRRDLSGTPLARSHSRRQAWTLLDALGTRLRERIGFRLASTQAELELERSGARDALAAEMAAAAATPEGLVVFGEPDVGKSALTLRAAERLEAAGIAVTTLSLRDLPARTIELESLLGGPLSEVLASTASGTGRLLVIDAAEAVLEGRDALLADVATAALHAGLGVIGVTRRDGAGAVTEVLRRAMGAEAKAAPRQHEVPRLTVAEVAQITEAFPLVGRLGEEPRAAWLLARPGLVDLLLRAGPPLDLPDGPLSEADVFAAVWHRLVRRGEVTMAGGPPPDSRDRALTAIARRLLLPQRPGQPPDANALPSLRSDGLLLSPGATSAWSQGDQYASDLIRDLSVARLLITDGWGLLDEAGAPRWALRAVRLACQSALASASDIEEVRTRLQAVFDGLAARHGARWAEVPVEAMLTLGSAEEALSRAWAGLLDNEQAGLRTVLRLALQRYTEHGFGDPFVLTPLVRLAYCGPDDLGQDDRYVRHDTGQQIRDLVLAWLRGLATTDAAPVPLRQRVRDRLLGANLEAHDEFAVEAVATLGADLDQRAEGFLRALAEDGGGYLAPAVESVGAVMGQSTHQPELLIDLTEAFYIIARHDDDDWYSDLEGGIRHHEKAGGFGVPMAAWYFGPFFRLLNTRPVESLALINRILDHAAAVRVGPGRDSHPRVPVSEAPLPGIDLDLPGVDRRRYIGDAHVWSWYRGSSVGPYACMSALLAVERFADHLVETLHLPLANVIEPLLRDSHNLAMPGLVVGLLVRHLEEAGDILDWALVRPELWQLEFSRIANEGVLHIQGPDSAELGGRNRRRFSFRDVVAEMTIRAMIASDSGRLIALASLGDELIRQARAPLGDSDEVADELITVEGWAAVFRPENYRTSPAEGGGIVVEFQHPEPIASGLAPTLAALARGNDALRLQLTYAKSEDRVAPVEALIEDLALARDLAANPPAHGPLHPLDAVAAVAAAAIVAHADRRASVRDDDLRWVAEVLVDAARQPHFDQMSVESSIFPMGADRSAAAALPALLLPPFDGLSLDRDAIHDALRQSARSLFDEVRASFAVGVAKVWTTPCDLNPGGVACRHAAAWTAVLEGLRDCRLGEWDQRGQRRLRDPLSGPYENTLPTVPTDSLLVNRLTAPLVSTAQAARSKSCVSKSAGRLLAVLLETHRRGWDHWARKGYGDHNDRQRPSVVRVLVEAAAAGDPTPLTGYVRMFASNARALDELLHDLAVLFTYDETLRPALPTVWRDVMTAALDALEAGADLRGDHHWSDSALAKLLPTPQLAMADTNPDSTLDRARQSWLVPDQIADLVERWLPIARGESDAVDALAQLVRCAPLSWQASSGLRWVEELIGGEFGAVARRCWFLPDWLDAVHASGQLTPEGTARWRRVVDGLAAAGDARAVTLQLAEE